MYAARHDKTLEVGGFARATIDLERNDIVVDDVLIPPQEIGGAHADMEEDDLLWLGAQVVSRGEHLKDWLVWWHSHAGMSTGPSQTDHDTLITLAKQSRAHYAVGLVVNAKGESTAWWVFESPMFPGVYIEQTLNVDVEEKLAPEIQDYIDHMMEHVVKKVWVPAQRGAILPHWSKGQFKQKNENKTLEDAWSKYLEKGLDDLSDDEFAIVMRRLQEETVGVGPFGDMWEVL